MVITPGRFLPEEVEIRRKYLQTKALPGTKINVVPLKRGPVTIRNEADFALLVPGVLERAEEAEKDGFDAIMVHGFCDFGVYPARCIVKIPVVGPAEATYHVACMLADKFGVITVSDETIPYFWRLAKFGGFAERITSMYPINIPISELIERRNELIKTFINLAKKSIKDGAQLIIPGCLAYLPVMGPGSVEMLEKEIGVQVLDPQAISLRIAEMLANLKLTHSKKAFPGS